MPVLTKNITVSQAVQESFKEMLLPEDILESVKRFLYFRASESVSRTGVPYNLLVQGDDPKRLELFALSLLNALTLIGSEKKNFCSMPEAELLADYPTLTKLSEKYSVLVLSDFSERPSEQWKKIQPEIEATPQLVKIICATDDVVNKRFRKDEHLYYRVLNQHISLRKMDSSDITEVFLTRLKAQGYLPTDDFCDGITRYINVVYPKADLKNEKFVDDLFNRVITSLFSSSVHNKQITASCIPYYNKPKSYEEIAELLQKAPAAKEVKEKLIGTVNVFRYQKKHSIQFSFSLNKVFIGEENMEKTAMAALYSQLLYSAGLINTGDPVQISAKNLCSENSDMSADTFLEACNNTTGKLLYIDHGDYLLNSACAPYTDILMQVLASHEASPTVVFAFNDIEAARTLFEKYPLPKEAMPETILFQPPSTDEWCDYFQKYCQEHHCETDESGLKTFGKIIESLRKNGKFQNWLSLKEIFNHALFSHASKYTGKDNEETVLNETDFEYYADILSSEITPNAAPILTPKEEWIKDSHIQKAPTQSGTTCVLLTAMSTFPRVIVKNIFNYNDDEYIGRSQLDPIPKMLSHELEKDGKCLDKIIMLCTDKTLEPTEKDTSEGQRISASPVDYFKYQIRDYMNPNLTDEERFVVVKIDEDSPARGIQDTITLIRNIPGIELYMDNHGGFRGLQLMLEAIISLLKNENISVKEIYGVQFGVNKIIAGDNELLMFDFVSGINEFVNYGRTTSLDNYFAHRPQPKLLTIVRDIAEGIQLCDIPKFEEGLKSLSAYYKRNKTESDPYLSLFEDRIKNDYGNLLDKERTIVDEIKWCHKKGFLQQAITLIEAKMPQVIFNKHILEYDKSKWDDFIEANKGPYNKYVFILNRSGRNLFLKETASSISEKDLSEAKKNEIRNISTFSASDNKCKTISPSDKLKPMEFYYKDHRNSKECHFLITSQNKDKGKLFRFLRLHFALKDLRNSLNHASEDKDNPEIEKINLAIETYIKLAESLIVEADKKIPDTKEVPEKAVRDTAAKASDKNPTNKSSTGV